MYIRRMTLSVGTNYDITISPIGPDHFTWLREKNYAGWVVIMDTHTEQHCLPLIEPYLKGSPIVKITVPPGETHKHLATCKFIWEEMFRGGVGRRWCCLNLGGGVIGDMGGFAASTFKRGMDFVQVPTTLLSQVDASVGGKLGIDFYEVKNSIGLFADPRAVWIDVRFLETLSERELRSGYAEVIKHALIADADQWTSLQRLGSLRGVDWATAIAESVVVKRDIVEQDPYERGVRKALNFGHTIGHAVESYHLHRQDRLLHGEAIAIGFITEAFLSAELGRLTNVDRDAISDYCVKLFGHQRLPKEIYPRLLALMRQDKKNEAAEINFTFLDAPGRASVNNTATADQITRSLDYYNWLSPIRMDV